MARLLIKRLAVAALCWAVAGSAVADTAWPQGRQGLTHQGLARSYVVRLPANAPPAGQRWPVVLVLHGGGGDAAITERTTSFTTVGQREGFVVVYPEGTGRLGNHLLTWNAGHCCGQALQRQVDDVGFIRRLIDALVATYPVDAKRFYATGISNGGMMTHRLGIELPDKLAAIAPVVAALFGDEKKPAQGVSALMINGALDTSVPLAGGAPGGRFANAWDGAHPLPATAQAAFWAGANGCTGAPAVTTQAAVQRTRYRCPAGLDVELVVVADHPHAWPGGVPGSRLGAKPSTALNATDEIWAFFKRHSR
ncbi:MAG TPA: PHB depolymerase family esterase [Ideonella sp.]|uniref:extracellular catalytic domain type 1 short-chain-length polyhydroxyalkanoate depolymerase n=1 Tax=Ideonella sp. TaxID=1929293 RepID=UPI002E34FD44|nr:PHB depolymerase family esterase [Ideonella sp.]HEX5683279.1 PHB depolymerase family esterase [Ideonella sp.]